MTQCVNFFHGEFRYFFPQWLKTSIPIEVHEFCRQPNIVFPKIIEQAVIPDPNSVASDAIGHYFVATLNHVSKQSAIGVNDFGVAEDHQYGLFFVGVERWV